MTAPARPRRPRAAPLHAADDGPFTAGVPDDEPIAGAGPDKGNTVVMSDDEAVPQQFLRRPVEPKPAPLPAATKAPLSPAADAPLSPVAAHSRYIYRIRVLEAFHYMGSVQHAPPWVDRGWVAYGDYDERRRLPAGPALLVPTPRTPSGVTLARSGDYVVRQEIVLAHGLAPVEAVEVWERDEFERLFVPLPGGEEADGLS
jgi:hypothetical protein